MGPTMVVSYSRDLNSRPVGHYIELQMLSRCCIEHQVS